MAEINAAYRQSAERVVALTAIFARSSASGRETPDDDMGRLRAEVMRLDGVISKIRSEIADVSRSEWMAMKLDAALTRARGIDWFELARRQTEMRAAERRAELHDLIAEFMELVRRSGLA